MIRERRRQAASRRKRGRPPCSKTWIELDARAHQATLPVPARSGPRGDAASQIFGSSSLPSRHKTDRNSKQKGCVVLWVEIHSSALGFGDGLRPLKTESERHASAT